MIGSRFNWLFAAALLAGTAPAAAGPEEDFQLCAHIVDDHAEAIRRCTAGIESAVFTGRDLAILYTNRAYEYRVTGNPERAIEDTDTAIGIDPELAVAWANRADALRDLGEIDGAIDAYLRTLELVSRNGGGNTTVGLGPELAALANLAVLYDGSGDRIAAEVHLRRAHAIAPDLAVLRALYGDYGID